MVSLSDKRHLRLKIFGLLSVKNLKNHLNLKNHGSDNLIGCQLSVISYQTIDIEISWLLAVVSCQSGRRKESGNFSHLISHISYLTSHPIYS